MAKLKAIILAAGQGTRMQSALPKVLHPLAGKPLLRHVIDTAVSLNPETIFVVYGSHTPEIRDFLSDAPVQWVLQDRPLGTGHAVQQALPYCEETDEVLVLYGDVPLIQPNTLRALLAQSQGDGQRLAILTAIAENPTGLGRIVRDSSQAICAIIEEKEASPAEKKIKEVNTGILASSAALLKTFLPRLSQENKQKEYYLTDLVSISVEEQIPICNILSEDPVETAGVNDCWQLALLERAYQRTQAEKLARAGVCIIDPQRLDIRGEVQISPGVVLDINVLIEGQVTIGPGSYIGPNVVLKGAQIGENVRILANSIVEESVVGDAVRLGPFARIRPDSQIAATAEIGNFVEVKKATIGEGTKVNHLAYVGNVTIEASVNVGGGVIFCNYNGENKFQSHVAEGAFIGSNTALVAPVNIGKEAIIGAGSLISRDAPAGKLTLSRSKQYTLDRWFKVQRQRGLDTDHA